MKSVSWILASCFVLGCQHDDRAMAEPQPFLSTVTAADSGRVFRGTFSPDASEFYFFRKVASTGEEYRIFRTTVGGGTPAEDLLALGDTNASSMYPVVSPDGGHLVFSSYRGPGDNANLWASPRTPTGWGEPSLLSASTEANYDASPWFDADGVLRFTSTTPDWRTTYHRRAARAGTGYGSPSPDTFWERFTFGPEYHFWSGLVDPSGSLAILEVSERRADGSLAGSDLWASRRESDGVWTTPAPLGGGINTESTENFPAFTPDGRTLVFVRGFSGFWSVAVEELGPGS
jgi:hypothetical protein